MSPLRIALASAALALLVSAALIWPARPAAADSGRDQPPDELWPTALTMTTTSTRVVEGSSVTLTATFDKPVPFDGGLNVYFGVYHRHAPFPSPSDYSINQLVHVKTGQTTASTVLRAIDDSELELLGPEIIAISATSNLPMVTRTTSEFRNGRHVLDFAILRAGRSVTSAEQLFEIVDNDGRRSEGSRASDVGAVRAPNLPPPAAEPQPQQVQQPEPVERQPQPQQVQQPEPVERQPQPQQVQQPEPVERQPQPQQPEPQQPEPQQPEPQQPEPQQPEPQQPEPQQAEPEQAQPEQAQPEQAQPEPVERQPQPEPAQPAEPEEPETQPQEIQEIEPVPRVEPESQAQVDETGRCADEESNRQIELYAVHVTSDTAKGDSPDGVGKSPCMPRSAAEDMANKVNTGKIGQASAAIYGPSTTSYTAFAVPCE